MNFDLDVTDAASRFDSEFKSKPKAGDAGEEIDVGKRSHIHGASQARGFRASRSTIRLPPLFNNFHSITENLIERFPFGVILGCRSRESISLIPASISYIFTP